MAHSRVRCDICNRKMRSDHLKRHMKTHKNGSTWSKPQEIPTFDGSEFGTDKTKSKETMDELKRFVLGEPPRKITRTDSSTSKDSLEQKQNLLPKLLDEYTKPKSLSELWLKRNHEDEDDHDGENEDDDDDDHDEDEDDDHDEENDDDEENQKESSVKLLPTTRVGLESRFNKLFGEFTRQKKLENRNELVFLLDEMLRHEYITPVDYESFNNILSESLESTGSEKADIRNLIQSTTKTLIRNDEEEVKKLIKEFKSVTDEETEMEEMEKSVEKFLKGELTLSSILDIGRKLGPKILLSKQLRLKMLLKDIADNRDRVQTILLRLNDGRDENTLKQLVREQLLSPEQHEKIKEDSDLIDIADIIKDTKVGRGLKFLPRTINDLKSKAQVLLKEIATKGIDAIKNELLAILDELMHKNGITKDEHTSITNDIKKGEGFGYYGYLL